jgi:hypothetical protein
VGSRRLIGISVALGTALLSACSVLAPADPRLCSAAQNLSAAMALTATAIDADERGDLARAQGLATEARSVTELANSMLRGMPDEKQTGVVWQALQLVYLGTAQAANSLLPAYANTHGVGRDELARAATSMDTARQGLPAMCFALPSDIETPASS